MHVIEPRATASHGLAELETYFSSIRPPYTLAHIRQFNRLYGRAYPSLNREERFRAEQWVDRMIDHVERKEWASKIFGVV